MAQWEHMWVELEPGYDLEEMEPVDTLEEGWAVVNRSIVRLGLAGWQAVGPVTVSVKCATATSLLFKRKVESRLTPEEYQKRWIGDAANGKP